MSLTLFVLSRRSIRLANTLLVSGLRPFRLSPSLCVTEFSTLKNKYPSIKQSTSSAANPFYEPTDEKSRRLKLQEQMQFRERFQLDSDFELIYSIPRQRLYEWMHFFCTCAAVTMVSFVFVYAYRDELEMGSLSKNVNQDVPEWVLYSVSLILTVMFGAVLAFLSRLPMRLYYSPTRRTYAAIYYPALTVFRQKKLAFRADQYRLVPQKLDDIDARERSIKISIETGQGRWNWTRSFYLVETYFRSRQDINRVRSENINFDDNVKREKEQPKPTANNEENDIWQTVMENKDQMHDRPVSSSRRPIKR